LEIPAAARVGHGERADGREVLHERFVDPGLETLGVGGVD
jgi:hypothetical protein